MKKLNVNNDTSLAVKEGKIVHIKDVRSGLGCNCYCANPDCGSKMIARKGKKNAHHFAHYNKENCGKSYESALHKLAKEIILEKKQIRIKPFADIVDKYGMQELIPEQDFIAQEVVVEKSCGKFKVDLFLKNQTRELIVEIFVSHKTEEEKTNYFKENNLSAIEIDLSELVDKQYELEKIKEIVLNDITKQTWLNVKDYNSLIESKIDELNEKERLKEQERIKKEELEKQEYSNRQIEHEKYMEELNKNRNPLTLLDKFIYFAMAVAIIVIIIKSKR